MVIDVGEWDNSKCINAPGQSGDPRSPHYGDLMKQWANGDYVPLLYSAEAVRAAAGGLEIELVPQTAVTPLRSVVVLSNANPARQRGAGGRQLLEGQSLSARDRAQPESYE